MLLDKAFQGLQLLKHDRFLPHKTLPGLCRATHHKLLLSPKRIGILRQCSEKIERRELLVMSKKIFRVI